MMRGKTLVIRIASHLLQYPDGELLESLSSISEWISELPPGRSRDILEGFLMNMQNRKLLSLQEEYSRIFDLNPATCLNLTYHKYGDKRERGAALARLNQVYRGAGYATATGELPDFLPLVLEFLSVCSGEEYAWIVQEYRSQMKTLWAQVRKSGSPYGDLLRLVLCSIRNPSFSREDQK